MKNHIAEWAGTLVILLFGWTTLLQAFVIPTASMENTLLVGDHVLVDKLAYAPSDPATRRLLPYEAVHRGDIIVFRWPVDISQTYVKRVIGVPGDRIHLQNKRLILNGRTLDEPYVVHNTSFIDPYRDNFPAEANPAALYPQGRLMLETNLAGGEVLVPPDCYFAMGDNRDDSSDSRYWGFVPRANINGKPVLIYWSYDASTQDLLAPVPTIGHVFDVAAHFFTKTRWDRMLRTVHSYPAP